MSRRERRPAKQDGVHGRRQWSREQRKVRRKLSQNFLKHGPIAGRIVAESGAGKDDLVVEFGAGGGMLTSQLARVSGEVVAVEYDPYWAGHLTERFSGNHNVSVVQEDAMSLALPGEPFKVVANIPFHATTPILHRLLDDPTLPLLAVHLVVQEQVALKHARPSPTTLKTLSWSPWYRFTAGLELPAETFYPRPRVDARLMAAAKRGPPLVDPGYRCLFLAFVRRAFEGHGNNLGKILRPVFTKTQLRRLARDHGFPLDIPPSRLTVHQWAGVFHFMIRTVPQERWPSARRESRR